MKIVPLKTKESISIGDEIKIFVRRIDTLGEIELGISASKTIPIHREEVLEKLKKLKSQLALIKD